MTLYFLDDSMCVFLYNSVRETRYKPVVALVTELNNIIGDLFFCYTTKIKPSEILLAIMTSVTDPGTFSATAERTSQTTRAAFKDVLIDVLCTSPSK